MAAHIRSGHATPHPQGATPRRWSPEPRRASAAEIARQLAQRGHGVTLVAPARRPAQDPGRRAGRSAPRPDRGHRGRPDRRRLAGRAAGRDRAPWAHRGHPGQQRRLHHHGPGAPGRRADGELAMVRTNVEAVVDLCTLFVAGMVTRHRGAILNTASTAAFQPLPGQAGYGASKSFVLSYGRALGAELRGTGVTRHHVVPGPGRDRLRRGIGPDRRRGGRDPAQDHVGAGRPRWPRPPSTAWPPGRPVVIPGAANRMAAALAHLAAQVAASCRSWPSAIPR